MKCKICHNEEKNKTYLIEEVMFGTKEKFNYLECSKCGCLQLIDEIEDMSLYYPENYYSFKEAGSSGKFSLKNLLLIQRNKYDLTNSGLVGKFLSKRRPSSLLKILNKTGISRDSKIMDVGCGQGHLLMKMKEVGFNNLLGIDPFLEEDIVYENGLQIKKKQITEVDGKWDLIMLHHVFEHLINPREILNHISTLLSQDGICLIRTPIASSYAWEHYRENWVQLDPPRHYFLHTTKSMDTLAQEAGMKIDEIIYDSNAFQFWGSEQIKNDIAIRSANSYAESPKDSMFTEEQIREYYQKAQNLNREGKGDQCAFFLRKA